jgi:hypothetical protein
MVATSRKQSPKVTSAPVEKPSEASKIELYKLIVEMADRVSQRRQAANSFYLTLNTLIFGSTAYVRTVDVPAPTVFALSTAGILASLLWSAGISSYKTLNTAKFSVIHEIEKTLHFQPFAEEWKRLDPDQDGIRHKPFHITESAVPRIFIGLYLFHILLTVNWGPVFGFIPDFVTRISTS